MVAKFEIIGRATRDTEIIEFNNGKIKANISLAVNDGENTYYYNIIAFEKTAELCGKYVVKGKQVYASGSIKPRSYEKEGKKVYVTDYIVQHIEFLGSTQQSTQKEDDSVPF